MSEAAIPLLRTRLLLEKPIDVIDDFGSIVRTWSPVTVVWGELKSKSMSGVFEADEQFSVNIWDVRIRWRPNIQSPMRFRKGERIFSIRSVLDPESTRKFLICRCEEYSSQ